MDHESRLIIDLLNFPYFFKGGKEIPKVLVLARFKKISKYGPRIYIIPEE